LEAASLQLGKESVANSAALEKIRLSRKANMVHFVFMPKKPLKAYRNQEFLNSPEARAIRVQCELVEPEKRFREKDVSHTIVFFGSARCPSLENATDEFSKRRADSYEAARALSRKLTQWSDELPDASKRLVVCSGGGPGIMEAANRGARDADGQSVALGISLPFEQGVNEYACPDLSFEFHYFFVRKFYFLYHAKALVVFPGGFGTMDELFESLTLIQTGKLDKKLPIILYDKEFWNDIIDFDQFVRWGVISPDDLNLFSFADNVDEAFSQVVEGLQTYHL